MLIQEANALAFVPQAMLEKAASEEGCELKKILFRYSDSIDKCRDFLTTTSTVFTVRVTAVSGVAKVVAVAGMIKEGRQVKRIAVISD